jgi:hypothetical protein
VSPPVDRTRIDELRRLHAEATPGPWEWTGGEPSDDRAKMCISWDGPDADAKLIAALRNNAEALLDAAEALHRIAGVGRVPPCGGACKPDVLCGTCIARRALAGIEVPRG